MRLKEQFRSLFNPKYLKMWPSDKTSQDERQDGEVNPKNFELRLCQELSRSKDELLLDRTRVEQNCNGWQ